MNPRLEPVEANNGCIIKEELSHPSRTNGGILMMLAALVA